MTKPTTKQPIKTPNRIKPKARIKNNKWPDRPLTSELMRRVKRIIDESEKKITVHTVAADIGHWHSEVAEWIGMWRSAPNGETTLKMLAWAEQHEVKEINRKG